MKKELATYWDIPHDTWSIHKYGAGYKVTYLKFGARAQKYKQEYLLKDCGECSDEVNADERFSQSVSRTKSSIFELAMCNEFSYFCTFTQNENLVGDRFDLSEFRKDLSQFVRNQNRGRKNKIKYLLIPEQHRNGAWHMHGLLMGLNYSDLREFTLDEKLPYRIRKQIKKGEKVYNWEKYATKFGFFTATEIKSHEACSRYITKYITKDLLKSNIESGKHTFFASKGLNRRILISRVSNEICPLKKWDFENEYIKSIWFSNKEELMEALYKNRQLLAEKSCFRDSS